MLGVCSCLEVISTFYNNIIFFIKEKTFKWFGCLVILESIDQVTC